MSKVYNLYLKFIHGVSLHSPVLSFVPMQSYEAAGRNTSVLVVLTSMAATLHKWYHIIRRRKQWKPYSHVYSIGIVYRQTLFVMMRLKNNVSECQPIKCSLLTTNIFETQMILQVLSYHLSAWDNKSIDLSSRVVTTLISLVSGTDGMLLSKGTNEITTYRPNIMLNCKIIMHQVTANNGSNVIIY